MSTPPLALNFQQLDALLRRTPDRLLLADDSPAGAVFQLDRAWAPGDKLPDGIKILPPPALQGSRPVLSLAPGLLFMPAFLSPAEQLDVAQNLLFEWILPPNHSNLTRLGKTTATTYDVRNHPLDERLRWVTLGHQYDWSSRTFDGHVPMAAEVASLAQRAVKAAVRAAGPEIDTGDWDIKDDGSGYEPNCAIVNFYRKGDRLRGHRDEVEGENGVPLVSFSLGRPALFLHEAAASALVLRAGDVLVMGGRTARLGKHSVPRLLGYCPGHTKEKKRTNQPAEPDPPADNPPFSSPSSVRAVLRETRINISIRERRTS